MNLRRTTGVEENLIAVISHAGDLLIRWLNSSNSHILIFRENFRAWGARFRFRTIDIRHISWHCLCRIAGEVTLTYSVNDIILLSFSYQKSLPRSWLLFCMKLLFNWCLSPSVGKAWLFPAPWTVGLPLLVKFEKGSSALRRFDFAFWRCRIARGLKTSQKWVSTVLRLNAPD